MKKLHFISGLPRSGSTLLCNILMQNPRFHCTPTSGCYSVVSNVRQNWDQVTEHRAAPDETSRTGTMRGILAGYHSGINRPVVFNKHRMWPSLLEMLETLMPVKIIATVRPVPEVLASFERLYRETSKTRQVPVSDGDRRAFQTCEGRCEVWMREIIGPSHNVLVDAVARGHRTAFYFVKFSDLTTYPGGVLDDLYGFLGQEPFEHDWNNVEQQTHEDDSVHGYLGLHKIRPKVEPVEPYAEKVLGQALVEKYQQFEIKWGG